jgi:hypothetical protein
MRCRAAVDFVIMTPEASHLKAGGTGTMKKKVRLFVLCHEYVCAVVLSIVGALLTTFIMG